MYCARFVRGYRFLHAKANCPPLVPLLDLFEQNGTAYVVMAYIEGETLAQRVKAHGAIPPRALMRMMRPFLHDLAALHQRKIIHRRHHAPKTSSCAGKIRRYCWISAVRARRMTGR